MTTILPKDNPSWCFDDGGLTNISKSPIGVQLDWDLVTVRLKAYDSHQFNPLYSMDGGIILEDITPTRIEMFHHRIKVTLYWFAVTLPSKSKSGTTNRHQSCQENGSSQYNRATRSPQWRDQAFWPVPVSPLICHPSIVAFVLYCCDKSKYLLWKLLKRQIFID